VNFSLEPFPGEEGLPELRIAGTIGRQAEILSIGYALEGDLSRLALPAPALKPERKDRLWEETCLELFLAAPGSEIYWEFNLSPSGHWNAYRFASYRKGMREEEAFSSLPFLVRLEPGVLRLSLALDLGGTVPAGRDVEAGICAVVRTTAGKASHWALRHPGPRPDFHRRDGFALTIPPR
jgi:hypothetical protein